MELDDVLLAHLGVNLQFRLELEVEHVSWIMPIQDWERATYFLFHLGRHLALDDLERKALWRAG